MGTFLLICTAAAVTLLTLTARIEYSHIDLGCKTHELAFIGGVGPTIPDKVDVKLDTIHLGVNIKLY